MRLPGPAEVRERDAEIGQSLGIGRIRRHRRAEFLLGKVEAPFLAIALTAPQQHPGHDDLGAHQVDRGVRKPGLGAIRHMASEIGLRIRAVPKTAVGHRERLSQPGGVGPQFQRLLQPLDRLPVLALRERHFAKSAQSRRAGILVRQRLLE